MHTINSTKTERLHPHKFTLWVAICSIIMMFMAMTSAYIVKKNQANWLTFSLPLVFWYSTAIIMISSITMHVSLKSFYAREMKRYRTFTLITTFLGLLFFGLQITGFLNLETSNIHLLGKNSNPSASFLFVITCLHMLHVFGGVIALSIILIRAYSGRIKNYSSTPIEIVATYWHFVDILWIYLFLFFNWLR